MHQFFVFDAYINFLWSLFLSIGLFITFFSFCVREKNKSDWIILGMAIACSIAFNYFANSSSPNYVAEVEMVRQEKSFIPSRDVIQIPLNKYLIIKFRNSGKICLFKIEKFNQKSFLFHSILLRELSENKFTIQNSNRGKIYYSTSKTHDLFRDFKVVFLPINSLVIYPYYFYGYITNKEPSFDAKGVICLPESEITWIPINPTENPNRTEPYINKCSGRSAADGAAEADGGIH